MAWMKEFIEIPEKLNSKQRELLGQEIVDLISERTVSGYDKNNRPFKKYSKEYAKEKGQDNVDLVLSDDMLSNLEVLRHEKGKIVVGYAKEYDGMGKVEGNITGSYGGDPNPKKARDFLGLTKKDLAMLISKVRDESE